MNKEEYEKDLKARQEVHLKSLETKEDWKPCLHDQCPNCLGTGKSKFGLCIHSISCDCPKCTILGQANTKLNYPYGVRCLTVNPPIYEKYNINPDHSGTGNPIVLRRDCTTAQPPAFTLTRESVSGSTAKLTDSKAVSNGLTFTNGSHAYCISVIDEGQLDISKVGSCT